MRIELFSPQGSWKIQTDAAVFAEEAGFDAFACPEIAHDPFMALALASQRTQRIGLRTAIAVAFARSPMIAANQSWDLSSESGGRFVLGLGTQVQAHVERRFSATWTKPRSQLREYVLAIRAIHRAWEQKEKLKFQGEFYRFSLMTPEFSPEPTGRAPLPIYTAAVRPGMMELAGEVADGVRLHGFMTRRYLDEIAMPAIQRGLDSRSRARERFEVCGGGFIATGPDDETVRKMREVIRFRVAFYASTPSYWPVLELHGWKELGEKLRAMTISGRWQAMASEVPDDVLEAFCVAAPWRDLRAAVERRFGGVSDAIELAHLPGTTAPAVREVVEDLQRIPAIARDAVTRWDEIPAGEVDPARALATPHLLTATPHGTKPCPTSIASTVAP
jgi:probable F420-dependent oxidoreductase